MKIKLFEENDLFALETSVNKFLEPYDDERFIEVEFIPVSFTEETESKSSACTTTTYHSSKQITKFKFFAMVKVRDKLMKIIF
ncbi:sporulation protein Cse60 [Sporolactobacillus pectinivorans]|uniref:sporulation protein Cse60 n=1 Tax=Sporolactobacillus pectinivorans TaxID=1591408 RepID=UPI000C26111A|nr:sporulation protein Cse60 [Sporolactobacillus pectinivorans]